MSEPKQYFKGNDIDKAVDWVKQYLKTSEITVDIEGTHIESGARVSASGLVIEAESGFGKPDTIVVRLDKKARWSTEQMLSIGKPDSDKDDADIAAEEIYLRIKKKGERERERTTKKYKRDYEHHRARRRVYYERRDHHD